MFVAAAIKELRQCVLPTMVFLVSHYTMVAISQQAGEYGSSSEMVDKWTCMVVTFMYLRKCKWLWSLLRTVQLPVCA
jgi:cadmium resistance protein CadD (predicted permease)